MTTKSRTHSLLRKTRKRRAAATVELAVCLPVIVLLTLGSIESASMIFLRQALVQAAYESAKEAVRVNGSEATARERAVQVLGFRDIEDERVSFDPPNVDELEPGTPVTVTISAPGDSNSVIPFGPFRNRNISVTATMLKE